MAADEGDCTVQVVGPFSDEALCTLQLPTSSTVLHIKRRVQAALGVNVFCQRLVSLAGPEVEDHEVLASLPGVCVRLIRLGYADAGADEIRSFLRAADEGAAPEVERLLRLPLPPDCGSEPEKHTDIQTYRQTALQFASASGHLMVARLLLEAGADRDKASGHGATALMMASERGHLEVVRLLCKAGADKDKADVYGYGYTALMLACKQPHLEVVRLLLEAGADKDKMDRTGDAPLMSAVIAGRVGVVRLLLEAGADRDKVNSYGATALMRASERGNLEVVRLLCEAGVDTDKVDLYGCTASMRASENGHLEVVQLLCEAGAQEDQ